MTDLKQVAACIDGYVAAWNSNDPAEIVGLFTEHAQYRTAPYDPAWHGREQIVDRWLRRRDRPGETTFAWHPATR